MDLSQAGADFWNALGHFFLPVIVFIGAFSGAFFWASFSDADEREVRNTVFLIKALGLPILLTYLLDRNGYDVVRTWNDVSAIVGKHWFALGVVGGFLLGLHLLFAVVLFPRFVWSTRFRPEAWKSAGEEDRQRMVRDFIRRYTLDDWHADQVLELLGEPGKKTEQEWSYLLPNDRRLVIEFAQSGRARPPRLEGKYD